MKVEGRCHCGKIEYEVEVDETKVQICHCLDCQTLTGSAYRVTIPASPDLHVAKFGFEGDCHGRITSVSSRRLIKEARWRDVRFWP
jgi:hypothetical protein